MHGPPTSCSYATADGVGLPICQGRFEEPVRPWLLLLSLYYICAFRECRTVASAVTAMYDVIRQAERIGENAHPHHQQQQHLYYKSSIAYNPQLFRRTDQQPAYVYGLYASDAVMGSGVPVLPSTYGSNYSSVSAAAGTGWADPKWARSAIVDISCGGGVPRQSQYVSASEMGGAYGHVTPIGSAGPPRGLAAASRLAHCSSPSPSLASSSLAALQRLHQQHTTAVKSPENNDDDDDDSVLRCGVPSSPLSATYHSNADDTASRHIMLTGLIYFLSHCTVSEN